VPATNTPGSNIIAERLQELAATATAMTAPAASAALQAAAIQGGLAQLMADLVQAEQTPGLPAPVQAAIVQILDLRNTIAAEPTAADVKAALTNSALFSDANTATDMRAPDSDVLANPTRTDMKTALLALQQSLKTWLSAAPAIQIPSANVSAPSPSPTPAANPALSYRGAPPSDAKLPMGPQFTAPGFPPVESQGTVKALQAGTPIPASSQSPVSSQPPVTSETIMKLEETMAVSAAYAAADAPSDGPSLVPMPAAQQPALAQTTTSPPAGSSLLQAPAQSYATQTSEAGSSEQGLSPPPTTYPGAAAPQGQGVPPPTPSLPQPDFVFAAKTAPSGIAWPQEGAGPATPSNAAIAAEAKGQPESGVTNTTAPNLAPQTDMKSALLVLQQIVKTSLAIAMPQAYASAAAKNPANGTAQPQTESPPPPYRGAPTSAQRSLPTSLPVGADARQVGEVLIKRTDAALAHMKLLQLASLPEAPEDRPANQPAGPRWMFEIPFATPQGSTIAQFQISRDAKGGANEYTGPVWRARFSLDIEPIGPVHAQVALVGERAWVTLWAEREAGVQSLRAKESLLSQSLKDCDVAAEIAFCLGTPHRRVAAAGQFLDRAS
jgi:hypothetical protein